MIAPILPSVDALSTTVIAAPSTSLICAETACRQVSVSLRPFQLTMMTSTAIRTRLRCGVSAAPESTPGVPATAGEQRTHLYSCRSAAHGRTLAALSTLRTTDAPPRTVVSHREELPASRESAEWHPQTR